MLLREWLSDRRRRSAVAKRSPTSDPPEVAHALDYFIWLALDERQFVSGPQNLRVPSDDERYYNDILNHYFGTDDQDPTAWFVKEGYIVHRFTHRHGTLTRLVEHGTRLEHVPRLASDDVLVNPDGYPGYFTRLQDEGARFVRATPEQREKATVLAPMAAVIAPGIADEERILFTDGWFEVPYLIARQVIQDFLDPEALLL